MGLNIKNEVVERLAAEVARLAGETKTEAIRVALQERKDRMNVCDRKQRIDAYMAYLAKEVWPKIPPEIRGKSRTREELDEIIGYGPDGLPE